MIKEVNVELVSFLPFACFTSSLTLGVLTKADWVKEGEEQQWLDVLRNDPKAHFPIEHGYYMTLRPSTDQRKQNMSWDYAQAQELEFFKSKEPWCLQESLKTRLGTNNLIPALCKLLSGMIADRYASRGFA